MIRHGFLRSFVAAFLVFVCCPAHRLMAAPASGELQFFVQPDGSSFQGRLSGDEFFHYYRTSDGHPVVMDMKSRWWYYAAQDEEGVGAATDRRAGLDAPPSPAWLPVTPAAELNARAQRNYKASVPAKSTRSNGGVSNANVAVLLTSFKDRPNDMIFHPADFEKLLFDITDATVFSAREFYREMSFGQHDVTSGPPLPGTSSGIQDYIQTPQNHDYYGGSATDAGSTIEDGGRIKELARWRAEQADIAGFNFGPYDTNNDGWVDLMCLVYQGRGQASGGEPDTIWPVRSALDGAPANQQYYQTNDTNALGVPVKVKDFIIVPELAADFTISTIGVFAHEYGHGLGWPDFYDTQRPPNPALGEAASEGIGRWCLMSVGTHASAPGGKGGDRPTWANPWCRVACGWVNPVNVTTSLQDYALPEAKTVNSIVRMYPNGIPGPEYFLIENRHWPVTLPGAQPGFDIGIPGSGILIWHVDETKTSNRDEWWTVPGVGSRTTSGNYKVALVQADGLYEMERHINTGDATDPFTAGTSFTDTSQPSSRLYNGAASNVNVVNIRPRAADRSITADFIIGSDLQPPAVGLTTVVHGGRYYEGIIGSFGGIATDNATVTGVTVVLSRTSPLGYESYNWSAGTWEPGLGTDPPFIAQASLSGSGSSKTWTRSINSAHMPAGSYGLRYQATDSAGLKSAESATWFEIVFDANAPDITFSEPSPLENYMASPVPDFTGTAVNTTAPITVQAALKMESGIYAGRFIEWSTSNWSAAGVFTTANYYSSASVNWSIPMGARTLPEGRYQLFARVLNGDSRISPWRLQTFRVGQSVRVAVTRPEQDALVSSLIDISGSITDPTGSGIAGSAVSLRLTNPLGESWNGTAFVSSPVYLSAPVVGNTWSWPTVPSPSLLMAGTYAISVTAAANNGETAPIQIGVNQTIFTVDNLPPAAAILSPAPGSVITTSPLPAFHGTMADPGGIGYVNCYIRRNRDGAFWTGNTWTVEITGAPPQAAPPVAALNATWNATAGTWSCTTPLPRPRLDMENGSYNFIVIAADRAGNYIQTDSAVTLDYHQLFVWTGATLRDGSASNNSNRWETWQNWAPYGVPGPEDYAQISNGDTVVINTPLTIRGFRLTNGVLASAAGSSLTTTHDSTWTGGWISGEWTNPAGASVIASGPEHKYFSNGAVMNNAGLLEWQGGGSLISQGLGSAPVTINNQPGGILRISGSGNLFTVQSASILPIFNNLTGGRIEKTVSTGVAYWYYWTLNNDSDIFINSGELYPFANTVHFRTASALMGSGTFRLNTNFYLHTDLFATARTEFIGGFLSCTENAERTWSGPGVLNWSSGTIYGRLTRPSGTATTLSGTDEKELYDGAELINEGTVTWTGNGNIRGRSVNSPGAVIRNRGTFLADTPADIVPLSGSVLSNFYNEAGATFTKTNPDTTYSTWQFHNAGTVNINEGWLEWHRNGTHTGTFNIAANCWLHLIAGTHSVADGMPFNGAGNVLVNGATVNAAGVLNNNLTGGVELRNGWLSVNPQLRGSGPWKWTGGGISGTASLGAGCTLDVYDRAGSPDTKEFWDDTTFDNYGTLTWQGGSPIRSRNVSGAPLTFNNYSLLRVTADGTLFQQLSANTKSVFNHKPGARIEKSAGAGTVYWYHWTLNSESEIAIQNGGLYCYVNRLNLHDGTALTGSGTFYLNTDAYLYATRIHSTVTTQWIGVFLSAVGGTKEWAGPGPFNWTSGTLYGSLKLAAGVTANLSGSDNKELYDGAELINEGTVTWTGNGNIRGRSVNSPGAVIRNRGTFLADTPADIVPLSGNVLSNFYNEAGATFTKTNPDTTYSTWQFHNAGTVNVNEGWLEWHRNGTHTGTFNIAANCWLHLIAGTHSVADGMPFNGAGNVLMNGATMNAAGVLNNNLTGGVELRNGWLSVNPQLRGSGPWKWTGGGISGTASLGAGCTLDVYDRPGGADIKEFWDDTTFDNYGTFTWLGGSYIRSRNVSGAPLTFNNHSLLRITADGTLFQQSSANTKSVFNHKPGARIEKSAGAGTVYWYHWTLNSESEIAIQNGGLYCYVNRLNLHDGTALTGSGTLYLNTDAYLYATRIHSTVTTQWTGVFLSAVGGTKEWAGPGPFNWTSGTLWGSLKFAQGVNVSLSGADSKEFAPAAELINEGTVTMTGTGVISGRTTTATVTIRNRPGALWRQDTTAFIQWQSANNQGLFENAGNVEIGAGVFYLNGWRFNQTATGAIYSDVTATGHDQVYVYNVPVTAGGTLHLRRAAGFTPPQGTYYNVLTGTSRSGTFANVTGAFTTDYLPTLARVTALPPAETYDQWIAAAGYTGPDALPTADPDADGVDNFTEFAFKGNPAIAGDLSWDRTLEEIEGESWLTLHYRRWQDREQAGVVYNPGAAFDLAAWSLSGLIDEPDTAASAIPGSTPWRARIRLGGLPRFLRVALTGASP